MLMNDGKLYQNLAHLMRDVFDPLRSAFGLRTQNSTEQFTLLFRINNSDDHVNVGELTNWS